VITGLYTPDSGTFELAGKPYTPSAVHEVAKAGIARTFQNIRLFADMTALENVMVGRHIRTGSGLLGAIFRTPNFKAEEAAIAKRAQELLDYVGIGRSPTTRRARCRTATSAAWRSPARWPPTRS
jgi:branched-chain amino acid transport system ATP-binding protein